MTDRAPHICFVAPNAFPVVTGDESSQLIGGAEVQQTTVARGLVARGYKVSMICMDFGQDAVVDFDGIRILRAFRIDAGIPVVRFVWPRMTSLWSCMRLANADVYYQRGAGMLTGLVAAYCKRYGKRSIFSASGTPDFERNTPRIRYRRDRWLYEYGLRHVDRLLAQNPEQVHLCLRNFSRPCALVPNCYEAPRSSRAVTGRDILWVGTIRKLKRPELFLDLAAALPQYQFTMVGGSAGLDRGLYSRVKARAEATSNVKFVGFVPYSQIDEHFDRAALLINTLQSEGFPNTFLQAWSRGVVTVASVDCGARLDGVPVGRVVSSREQFIEVLEDLMSNNLRRQQEGMRCKEYFEHNHTPGRVLDMYEEIIGELITRERALPW